MIRFHKNIMSKPKTIALTMALELSIKAANIRSNLV